MPAKLLEEREALNLLARRQPLSLCKPPKKKKKGRVEILEEVIDEDITVTRKVFIPYKSQPFPKLRALIRKNKPVLGQ
jgi:hypothetical protein